MARLAQKLFGDTPWPFVINGIISLVCSFGAVTVADQHAADLERRQQTRADHQADYADYVRVTDRFDSAAQTYAGLILSNEKVDERARSDFLANLEDQKRTLDRVGGGLPRSDRATVERYEAALNSLSTSVNKVSGIADMAPYWQNMNNVLVIRHDLDRDFKSAESNNG